MPNCLAGGVAARSAARTHLLIAAPAPRASRPRAASIFAGYQIDRRVYVNWGQYTVVSCGPRNEEAEPGLRRRGHGVPVPCSRRAWAGQRCRRKGRGACLHAGSFALALTCRLRARRLDAGRGRAAADHLCAGRAPQPAVCAHQASNRTLPVHAACARCLSLLRGLASPALSAPSAHTARQHAPSADAADMTRLPRRGGQSCGQATVARLSRDIGA